MRRRVIVGLATTLLAGCAGSNPWVVQMKHPDTGKVVQCGPYPLTAAGAIFQSTCVQSFEKQGYERQP